MSLVFLDSNIFSYAYDVDAKDKYEKAQSIVRSCWEEQSGLISTQVLQEFYITVTKKISQPIPLAKARDVLQAYQSWPLFRPDVEDIIAASELQERYKYSFWDSLIIIAAQNLGATLLYSEDMQDAQHIGSLTIVNPFK